MHERGVSRFEYEGTVRQVMRGESLQHHTCRDLHVEVRRQRDELPRRHDGVLRVRAERHRPGHAIADLEVRHSRSEF